MHTITAKQIKKLRSTLKLSQDGFADKFGLARSTVCGWETGNSVPRSNNRAELIALYQSTFERNGKKGTTPQAASRKTNGKANGHNGHSKGGRHKVAVGKIQECMTDLDMHLMGSRADSAARFVAQRYGLDFATFRLALVVFLYGMETVPASHVAQGLSGHK